MSEVAARPGQSGSGVRVGVVMGSQSDLAKMSKARETLSELGIECELRVISAHRTPEEAAAYARNAEERGLCVIIAGAGGAAHLAGIMAAYTALPVIGVPIASGALGGFDALCATVMMPSGVPVATVAIDGAANAGILAAQIIALSDGEVKQRLVEYRWTIAEKVRQADAQVRALQ
ncbi:MAG TPA: 5-(carboxyamino)imidazole ribonucleotide mutase [Bacillota bacterium]|nr:5-(carboxyamino)imidazole ribonucleotide mutase [Bacillota bacterium]